MLDSWNNSIFNNIKHRLQTSAMKLVRDERYGDAFDTQLVIGVRESYGKDKDRFISHMSVDCGSYKLYVSVCLSVPLLWLISRLLWVGFWSNLVKMLEIWSD